MKNSMKLILGTAAIAGAVALTGCTESSADTVSYNISEAAENFEVQRTIVFYNGITDKVIAQVEGACSIERDGEKMQAICRVGEDEYTRDEIGLSDNVTYFALQNETIDASRYHKRIIFAPETVVPEFDYEGGKQ
jgi:hypothetical protein